MLQDFTASNHKHTIKYKLSKLTRWPQTRLLWRKEKTNSLLAFQQTNWEKIQQKQQRTGAASFKILSFALNTKSKRVHRPESDFTDTLNTIWSIYTSTGTFSSFSIFTSAYKAAFQLLQCVFLALSLQLLSALKCDIVLKFVSTLQLLFLHFQYVLHLKLRFNFLQFSFCTPSDFLTPFGA